MKLVLLFLTLFLLISCVQGPTVPEMEAADRVQQIVISSQEMLPLKLDKHTRLERVSGEGDELIHRYTLIDTENMSPSDLLSNTRLINDTCSNAELYRLISQGVTIHHIYFDAEGKELKNIRIDLWDCNSDTEAVEDW